jgi:hypothetical protein
MKPKLKAPATERLKLKYRNLVSRFAFAFNLRRYVPDATWGVKTDWVSPGDSRFYVLTPRPWAEWEAAEGRGAGASDESSDDFSVRESGLATA